MERREKGEVDESKEEDRKETGDNKDLAGKPYQKCSSAAGKGKDPVCTWAMKGVHRRKYMRLTVSQHPGYDSMAVEALSAQYMFGTEAGSGLGLCQLSNSLEDVTPFVI